MRLQLLISDRKSLEVRHLAEERHLVLAFVQSEVLES